MELFKTIYLKEAFLFHWNLFIFLTGIVLSIILGYPDIIMPIVFSLEILYLALLISNKRFRKAIDAKYQKEIILPKKTDDMLNSICLTDQRLFRELKSRCLKLLNIDNPSLLSDVHIEGMNKLLWIYLKLLYSKNSLESFFNTISVEEIESTIKKAEKRLSELGIEEKDDMDKTKYRKSLSDTINTSKQRLENYNIALKNYNFIGLELERLYSKIASLAEIAINRQDSDFIISEIDGVSASVLQTETTIKELNFLTGFSSEDDMPANILADN